MELINVILPSLVSFAAGALAGGYGVVFYMKNHIMDYNEEEAEDVFYE